MKALVFGGPGQRSWDSVEDPGIQEPTDVIVKVDTTTICGTDLHILKGDVPAVEPGRVLGHEGVGTVVETGTGVTRFRPGDRVLIPCISSCGACSYCLKGMQSHCQALPGGFGWALGNSMDGTQAEYVRVPFGNTSLHHAPREITDEQLVMLSDIYATGFEIGVQYGGVKPGDVVVVIGVGPVGLAAVATAGLYGPSKVIAVGRSQPRIDRALKMGADLGFSTRDPEWADKVMAETDGLGADVVIEAVGVPQTLEDCFRVGRPGGRVANTGVHGKPVKIPMQDLWIANITLTTGLVDTSSTRVLLDLVKARKLHPEEMVTHRLELDDFEKAYEIFGDAPAHDALKVVLHRA